MLDLTQFTPEQIAALKAQLSGVDGTGRSPFRPRQLNDLRILPSATDPRPTFFWSATTPPDFVPGPYKEYPKLLWHQTTGQEVTAHNAEDEQRYGSEYASVPFASVPADPITDMATALAGLTPEEQAIILKEQKKDRLSQLQAKLSGLSEAELERVLGKVGAEKRQQKKSA
jgi:hypothetical protein